MYLHMVEGARELYVISFIRTPIPLLRAPPLLPNHLPKSIISPLGVRISTYKFGGTQTFRPYIATTHTYDTDRASSPLCTSVFPSVNWGNSCGLQRFKSLALKHIACYEHRAQMVFSLTFDKSILKWLQGTQVQLIFFFN